MQNDKNGEMIFFYSDSDPHENKILDAFLTYA